MSASVCVEPYSAQRKRTQPREARMLVTTPLGHCLGATRAAVIKSEPRKGVGRIVGAIYDSAPLAAIRAKSSSP
jgi:hypothetical protein